MPFLRLLARIWTVLLGSAALALTLALAARFVIPLTPWAPAPRLVAVDPPDSAADVLPRSSITLRFSAPMNRASVEAALRIDPPAEGTISWSPDATALTFQPSAPLAPASTYTVSLDGSALGHWWRPLAEPALARFRTAPQPAVVAAMPGPAGAPPDTALAVVFSQPMVPPEAVGAPARLPELRLEPEAPLSARWADQSTLVLFPDEPLAPATRYTATLGASLADLRGVELGEPFSWSFTTGWPAIVGRSPEDGARWVSPSAPLTLRLAAPLDPDLLRQALQIAPAVEGDLASEVIGATQVVTFTPRSGWAHGTTYSVALVEPPGSGLGPPPALPWRFSVGPRPGLVAFFPGQGQVLPPDEAVRLVFSTPMDEASLLAGLSIEPPVDELSLSVNETEVRLLSALRPSTLYTITLDADTRDRGGEPLGAPAVVQLRTAPARPALAAPEAVAGIVTLPVSRTAELRLESTNLSALDLSLYPLDRATLLRALEMGPDEWATFSPERYGQALARAWRVTPTAPVDEPGPVPVELAMDDGAPLPPGAYYLRVTSPEGPRADLILLASEARLTMRQGPGFTLLWATDAAGAPIPDLPVALYEGSALVASGQTGPDGVWVQPLARGPADPPLLALSEGDAPALARGDWLIGAPPAADPAVRGLLFPDRASYAPGGRVHVRGLARSRAADGSLTLPPADTTCRLQLRAEGGAGLGPAVPCGVEAATGAISGTLALGQRLAPGDYSLSAQIGDEQLSVPLRVDAPERPRFALAVAPADDGLQLHLTRGGLPLAGAVVSWSLRLEPLAAPAPPAGFVIGPLEAGGATTLSGQAITDADGRVRIGLPPEPAGARAYRLRLSLPGDDSGLAFAEGVLDPGPTLAAVELPSRLVASDQRSSVGLLALDGLGQPQAGARLRVEVYRAGSPGAPVLARQAISGPDGRAQVELVQLSPGEYEVVASAGGPETRAPLWVFGARFAGWRADEGRLTLVADRDRYRPGDTATLLVATPEVTGSLLLTVERGELLGAEVRQMRPGQVVLLPITADMAPGVVVGAVLTDGEARRAGAVALTVDAQAESLAAQLELPPDDALPGATAPLTVTIAGGGAPMMVADTLVTVAPAGWAAGVAPLERFAPGPPPASTVAGLQPAALAAEPAARRPTPMPPGYAVPIAGATGAPGLLTGQIALPGDVGAWQVTAYAASGPDRVVAGSAAVTTSLPLAIDLVAPPALRPGDRATAGLHLSNGGAITREVTVTVAAEGLSLDPAPRAAQRLSIPPGDSAALSWELAADPAFAAGRLELTVETPGFSERVSHELAILAREPSPQAGTTLIGQGPLATAIDLGPEARGLVTVALAPGLRAALADQAERLSSLADPSVEERAALALIAAGLAEGAADDERERWSQMAQAALAALDEAQNADGGWGWWPGAPSQPFITAFALEAQTAARAALPEARPPSLRAVAYLGRAAPAADADTRAYIAYALARAGRSDPGTAALREAELGPDGLAFLALALPTGQAAPLLDELQARAERAPATPGRIAPVRWSADEPAGLPRAPVAVTAPAAQALAARRPSAPELPGAEEALLRAWGVAGWPTAYEAARVAAALLAEAPPAGDGPVRLSLGDAAPIGGDAPLAAVRRATLAADELPARPELRVEADGPARYMVAYSLPAEEPDPAPQLSLLEELVDPASGAPVDPATLRAGQLVGIRLTVVVARPLARADIELPLPAGLALAAATPRPPFQQAGEAGPGRARLGAADLAPGVYTQLILARAVAAGSFAAPPARLTDPFAPGQAAVAPAGLAVTIAE